MQGDVSSSGWVSSGGDPGGYYQWVDAATGGNCYFVAPSKFLGNQSAMYGGTLIYDLQDSGDNDNSGTAIELTGNGMTIDFAYAGTPGVTPAWNELGANLTETGWVIDGTSTAVTAAQFKAVLANLTQLIILGEYVDGPETGGIDNVEMNSAMTSTGLDTWSYVGNWQTNPTFWSLGAPPTASNDVLITSGGVANLTSAGVAATIYINPYGTINVTAGGNLHATNITTSNAGALLVANGNADGVDTVVLTGTLTNAGQFTLGNSNLSASTTFTTAKLANAGTIDLYGNQNLGTTDQATLNIGSAAPNVLTGSWLIHGDSLVEFASGGITTISSGAELQLDGQQARFSIGAGTTNSALSGLASNAGTFDEEGDWSTGPGGSTVVTTTNLANTGTLDLDTYNSDGASQLTIGGVLTNTGAVAIGNSSLSANTTMTVNGLSNLGTINLYGNQSLGTTDLATLNVKAAAPTTLTGYISAHGDSLVEFASGGIQSIGIGAELQLDGQQARFSIGAGTTNSALSTLSSNYGTFDEEGDWSTGPGGSTVTTTVAFTNYGSFSLDVYGGDGASAFTDSGVFTNNSYVQIGNGALSVSTTLSVLDFANNGTVYLESQNTGGAGKPLAELKVQNAAPTSETGYLHLAGNSLVSFGSTASINSIAAGGEIELDGGAASIANATGGSNSALKGLNSNAGTLLLVGGGGLGSSVALATNVAFTNSGTLNVDIYSGNGGSTFTIGGALTNTGTVNIGNQNLSAATTVSATSLSNTGAINIQGNTAATGAAQAKLAIIGAAPTSVTNRIDVAGNGALTFGSGAGFTSVTSTGWLELDGAQANIAVGSGGQNSGLASLASNAGNFLLRGDQYGSGGVSLTIAGNFANSGTAYIDAYGGNDGGSTFNVAGTLTNTNTLYIGNQNLSANTLVTATTFHNSGSFTLQGGTAASGAAKATLAVAGAAIGAVTSYARVSGDATLSYGSGTGYTSISATGGLELDGDQASVQIGLSGAQNSGVSALALNRGKFILRGNQFGVGGVAVTTTTNFTNYGTTYIDAYGGGDGGSTFHIGGQLNNAGAFNIGNQNMSAATTVTAAALNDTGSLTIQGASSGIAATLDITGPALSNLTGFVRIGGDATLDYVSGAGFTNIAKGGWLELDSQYAGVDIGSGAQNSGLRGLQGNAGDFVLRGGQYGSGGVSVTTTGQFINSGVAYIDGYGNGDGGSTFAVGAALVNQGVFVVGNNSLSAATTVTANSLVNSGSLTVSGSTYVGGSVAMLSISGAAPGTITSNIRVDGNADLNFDSGAITTLAAGATLEIDSSLASLSVGGSAGNSALSKFALNAGTFVLRGDAYGPGGADVTTTTGLTNTGTAYVDYYNGDGGSAITLGGTLSNQGHFNLGNFYNAAATSLSATNLSNLSGQLTVTGGGYLTTLSVSGVANNYAALTVNTGGLLAVTGAYTQFAGSTSISGALSASAYTQSGGSTTVYGSINAATLNDRGGAVDFKSALTSSSTLTALNIQNASSLEFDAGVSSSQTVTFQDPSGTLNFGAGDAGGFNGTISGFAAGDTIDLLQTAATSLAYAGGVLEVFNGGTEIAALHMAGSYTSSSFSLVGDNNFGTKIIG